MRVPVKGWCKVKERLKKGRKGGMLTVYIMMIMMVKINVRDIGSSKGANGERKFDSGTIKRANKTKAGHEMS